MGYSPGSEMARTLDQYLADARAHILRALDEGSVWSADDRVRNSLFAHQAEVAQDRVLVEAVMRTAAAGGRESVRLLGLLREHEAVPLLLDGLTDPAMSMNAREALERFDRADVLATLRDGLASDDPAARVRTIEIAVAGKYVLSVGEVLTSALDDVDRAVRLAAANGLGELIAPPLTQRLLESLSGDPDEEVRAAAADAVGQTGDSAAVAPLAAALGDQAAHVRATSAAALGQPGDPGALPALARAAQDPAADVRAGAVIGLGRLKGDEAVDVLARLAADRSAAVREAVATWLRFTGTGREVALLKPLLADADARVGASAIESLARLADGGAQRHAVSALGQARRARSAQVRLAAIEALAGVDDPDVTRELERFLKDAQSRVRLAAACVLLDRPNARARRALQRLARDPDPRLRRIVAELEARGYEPEPRFRAPWRRDKEDAWP
jgi:HEAT repeat protein